MSTKLAARTLPVCFFSLLILAFCLSTPYRIHAGAAGGTTSTPLAASALAANYGSLPLSFERNDGQTDAQVKFLSRGGGYSMFLTSSGAVLVLSKPLPASPQPTNAASKGNKAGMQAWGKNLPPRMAATVVRLQLAGAKLNPAPKIGGLAELPGRSNYFRGSDRSQWVTNIPNYRQIEYRGVYPGVDMVYYGNQRQLEYDMVVAPHADPSAIRFQVQGAQNMEVSPSGDLMLHTSGGDVVLRKPVLYQQSVSKNTAASSAGTQSSAPTDQTAQREPVNGSYSIQGNEIQFHVGAYDSSRPLVIDPVLSYSTFLGGSSLDQGSGIAVDSSGNAYVAGNTDSPDFPTTNTINPFNQGQMVFIVKLNPSGSTLLYSTYLGGAALGDFDSASGIAIDNSSPPNVYVSGTTSDADFPVTSNAYLPTAPDPNSNNVFVTKVSGAGNALLYSTYLGGTDNSGTFQSSNLGNSIAADASGNVYVTGNTSCDDFPTVNAFQSANPIGLGFNTFVPFVSKLNTNVSGNPSTALVYSTYLGGKTPNIFNSADGIATNGAGKVYITGGTNAPDFPTTPSAFQNALVANSQNAFVSVIDTTQPGVPSLLYSTYLGGTTRGTGDAGAGIVVDATGNIDVTGVTGATGFPVTPNAFQSGPTDTCSNAFVSQLDPTKSGSASLVYSTYFGGSSLGQCAEQGIGIAADATGKIYITGQTDSPSFPVKNPLQAMQPENLGFAPSAFVSQFDPSQALGANTLLFSTYLGGSKGSGGDHGYGIAVDSTAANIFVAGGTDSYDFPVVNPLQLYNSNGDAFVAKINMAGASPATLLMPAALTFDFQAGGTSSGPKTITLTNVGNAALTLSGISLNSSAFNQTNTCGTLPVSLAAGASCAIKVVYSPPVSGNWSATVVVADSSLASPHRVAITSAGANVALASSLNPSTYGQAVTLTATVSSTVPGGPLKGTVQFFDGANPIATQPVVSGAAAFVSPVFLPGTHSFTAVYSGDGFRNGSNPSNVIAQVVNPAPTTTAVISSLNPSAFGAGLPPTFTATVTVTNGLTTVEGGTVVFKDGAVTLGTGTILADDTGQTTFTPASNTVLALGTHPITAIYQGDAVPANWAGSTSPVFSQMVNPPTSTALAAQINGQPAGGTAYFTRNPGQRLILTVTVTGNAGTPSGNVTLSDGTVRLGQATLTTVNPTTATATFQAVGLPVGLNRIVAIFPPNSTYAGSTSNTVMVYQSPRPKIH